MKKRTNPKPLEMVNFLTNQDPEKWEKLLDKGGEVSSLLCKEYVIKNFPDTAGILYALLKWVSPVIVNAEYENITTIYKVK